VAIAAAKAATAKEQGEGLLAEAVRREVGVLFDNAQLTKGFQDVLLAALSTCSEDE
jgi:hypothetical protein